MKTLDLYQFPLQGVSLIEASAGTGKTFTISGLYLRLLLERELTVRQILVVTFTNAATEELRDRIRRGIRTALQGFMQGHSDDPLVQHLLSVHPSRDIGCQQLRDALVCMDEAAIYTIHGFCQRLLQDHAFESGMLFEAEFITDEESYLRSIVEDFWRRHFYQASPELVAWVTRHWATPQALLSALRRLLKRDDLELLPTCRDEDLARDTQDWEQALDAFRRDWLREREPISEFLVNGPALKRNIYRPATLSQLVNQVDQYLAADAPALTLPERIELLTWPRLDAALKKGASLPSFDLPVRAERLIEAAQTVQLSRLSWWTQRALQYCREELVERKQRSQVISLDDLLSYSQQALLAPAGAALAAQLRQRYPVALIDEFQDTDPQQYRIFKTIYPDDTAGSLWMIGDPKQAIYSFRGADIFTYMQARSDTHEHYTLDTNWRSTSAMVAAVNALFAGAENPFIYQHAIDFHPVQAAGRADQAPLWIDGQRPVPLQLWLDASQPDKPLPKQQTRSHLAQRCAGEIARLLTLAGQGRATLADQPLRPRDLAVLVRSHTEARLVQQALREVGIASAYLSRDSVLASHEAVALQTLLLAVLEPANERLLRAAVAGEILLGTASELDTMMRDELVWEGLLNDFFGYHQQWQQHGFMAMFQRLLHQRDVAKRLLMLEDGERRLTNLLQLADLLQQASHQQHGMEGLMHWYHEQLQRPDGDHEDQQLRLESDADLVQIVTIHKSKGLEYPVVFMPYLWQGIGAKHELLFHHPDTGRLTLDLAQPGNDAHLALAERERLAEDLRLLYVALTRSKFLSYLAWGPYGDAQTSALGYLLVGNRQAGWAEYSASWQRLIENNPESIAVNEIPVPEVVGGQWAVPVAEPLQPRRFSGQIDTSWRVTSYSTLAGHGVGSRVTEAELTPRVTTEAPVGLNRFTFPRGANAGHMLHAMFEQLDFTQVQGDYADGVIQPLLQQYGFAEEWLSTLRDWLAAVLDTPLPEAGISLRQLPRPRRIDELEFHYPLANLQADSLNAVMTGLADYQGESGSLAFMPQRGMMTGFIDMVFEAGGRYYLLDYKSNHLGDSSAHYARPQLVQAMQAHRYDLQYLIYTVALHRYLRWRVSDYDYQRHFGGVYYLFIRGMSPESGASGVYFTRPDDALIDRLDALFAGRS